MPMHCSGMGKAVIASWTPEQVDRLVAEVGLPARTDRTITDPEQLRTELANVRQRGYALDLGENERGTVCVSTPIRDHLGRVMYGLSISSLELEYPGSTIEQFAPQAIAAADAIFSVVADDLAPHRIVPSPFDPRVAPAVAAAVAAAADPAR